MHDGPALCICLRSYIIAGLEPDGCKYFFPEISLKYFNLCKRRIIRPSMWIKWFKAFPSSAFNETIIITKIMT